MSNEIQAPVGLIKNQLVNLGSGASIDERVILGYPPSRGNSNRVLIIGDGAYIRDNTVIYGGSIIGGNLETGHNVVIREENEIGENFRIWNNSVVD